MEDESGTSDSSRSNANRSPSQKRKQDDEHALKMVPQTITGAFLQDAARKMARVRDRLDQQLQDLCAFENTQVDQFVSQVKLIRHHSAKENTEAAKFVVNRLLQQTMKKFDKEEQAKTQVNTIVTANDLSDFFPTEAGTNGNSGRNDREIEARVFDAITFVNAIPPEQRLFGSPRPTPEKTKDYDEEYESVVNLGANSEHASQTEHGPK